MDDKTTQNAAGNTSPEPRPKRPYVAPRLTEYGSIARLTQGTGATANGDGGQMMMV